LFYSPAPSAHTLLVNWPVKKVVADIPDMAKAAETSKMAMILRMGFLQTARTERID
jgi:hypothetical protein